MCKLLHISLSDIGILCYRLLLSFLAFLSLMKISFAVFVNHHSLHAKVIKNSRFSLERTLPKYWENKQRNQIHLFDQPCIFKLILIRTKMGLTLLLFVPVDRALLLSISDQNSLQHRCLLIFIFFIGVFQASVTDKRKARDERGAQVTHEKRK